MPFTLSHPAAVLPLLKGADGRGALVASALVAGSMAPDVPFFADSLLPGVFGLGALTHRWWAVPTVDVLLAGGLVVLWHGLVRAPLVALLPGRWAAAADAATAPGEPRPGWFALSAAVGAATHVGWDAFTHQGRLGIRALDRTVGGMPVHALLQYGTSVVGLACLARYAVRVAAAAEPAQPAQPVAPGLSRRARRAALAALAAATAAGVVHRLARGEGEPISEFCFGAGAGLAVGAVVYAASVRMLARAGATGTR